MKTLKKSLAILLAIVSLLTVFSTFSFSASAANASATTICNLGNIVTYAQPLSGASKIYAYTSSSLTTKVGSGYYVESFNEQIVIKGISGDGKAVSVRYLSSSGAKRDYWFKVADIFGISSISAKVCYAKTSTTGYRMKTSSTTTTYGSITKGNDKCYRIGSHTVGSTTYYPMIYKLSTTSIVNGLSCKYKMTMIKSSDYSSNFSTTLGHVHNYSTTGYEAAHPHKVYKKCSCGAYYYTGETKKVSSCTTCYPVTFSPVWPCNKSNYISTMYRYYNRGNPKNHSVRTNIYNAFDIAGTNGDAIYAVESGVVVDKGYQASGFGYYVTIRHPNGLYSLYGHLKQAASVNIDAPVRKQQVIGYMGSTGNSSGNHLHFELYNPNNYSAVINPWVTYYQGKVSVVVGGNSYRANINYTSDSRAQAWCKWLKNNCRINSAGDYVF